MISPKEAMARLVDGNKRFYEDASIHPNRCDETKNALLKQQKPFAAILACSDSRVPVEIIFDAGLGDLFVVRTAGHVLSKEVIGSLEYAVKSLGVKLIMILGHANCGAVKTAIETCNCQTENGLSENLQSIMDHILPAIKKVEKTDNYDEYLENSIDANIRYQIEDLINKDEYIAQKVNNFELKVIGAKYALDSGKVEILSCLGKKQNAQPIT